MPGRLNKNKSGRIRAHERVMDDADPTTAGGTAILEAHAVAILATEIKVISDAWHRDYRNCIGSFVAWLEKHYPDVFDKMTRMLSDVERADKVAFHHKNTRCLIYTGVNVDFSLAFLVIKRVKLVCDDGKEMISSHGHVRKFDDAIKFGSARAKQPLPMQYHAKVKNVLTLYKKDYAEAKKNGNVDEKEADTISSSLFRLMCRWFVEEGNVSALSYGLLQWNRMARSTNINERRVH